MLLYSNVDYETFVAVFDFSSKNAGDLW